MSYPTRSSYQVYPRAQMEQVLAGRMDGGEHLPLDAALLRAADACGVSSTDVRYWWRGRDRRSGRLYVANRRGRNGYIVAPAMPRLPQDGPTLFDI